MQELPPKKDVALFLIQRSPVFVHLDPRGEDVIVPADFKKQAQLVLQIGYGLQPPIPDLAIDDEGWSATLSFRRVPFRCVVPWKSVFAFATHDGRSMVWPDDVPPEIQQGASAARAAAASKPALAPVPPPAPSAPAAPAPKVEAAKPSPASEASSDPNRKTKTKKRAKKKKDVEAESSSASAAPTPAPAPEPAARPAAAAAKPTPLPVPAPAPSQPKVDAPASEGEAGRPPQKPKRELPHYIRVIK